MTIQPAQFDGKNIRRVYDEETEIWWFSVIDVVRALTDSENARDYWFKMKQRVRQEDGAELSTLCRQLKMPAADRKQRLKVHKTMSVGDRLSPTEIASRRRQELPYRRSHS